MSFDFPLELEDEIFRLAVSISPHKPEDAQLALVSKRVQSIVEPILYETVCLGNADRAAHGWTKHQRKFMFAIENRPPSFFKKHVKNLYMTLYDEYCIMMPDVASRVVTACSGVRNLFFYDGFSGPCGHAIAANIVKLPLQSIEVPSDFLYTLITHCLDLGYSLPTITHLTVLCSSHWKLRYDHRVFPNVTHVKFRTRLDGQWQMNVRDMGPIRILLSLNDLTVLTRLESVIIEVFDRNLFSEKLRKEGWNVDELEHDWKITIKQIEKPSYIDSGGWSWGYHGVCQRQWKKRLLNYYP